jgi:hypothetical protein
LKHDSNAKAQKMISRKPYEKFSTEIGHVGHRSIGGIRFRRHATDYIRNISYQNKPYGVPFKFWDILHYGRYTQYGYRMGRPKTIKSRSKSRPKKTDSAAIIVKKSRIRTRTEFDWHLASTLASAGWSLEQYLKLYENLASDLNIYRCLSLSTRAGLDYLNGKYQRAIQKLQQEPDSKRVTMGKFLRIRLEKRDQIGLKNGSISMLLGVLYARQRIPAPAITLSMRDLSLISNVDVSTISRLLPKLLGQWLNITQEADLARGNTYEIQDATIDGLYFDCFKEEPLPEKYLTTNCTTPLMDSVFVRGGSGLDGYLIMIKLALAGGPIELSSLVQHLNIDRRKLTSLLSKMESVGLLVCDGKLVRNPKSTDLKMSAISLGVAKFKARLNRKYQYDHKLHRFKLFAWGLRKQEFQESDKYAVTAYQKDLQQRFRRIYLSRQLHPGVTIGPQILRLCLDKDPGYRAWLQSPKGKLVRRCVDYVWRTGSYVVHVDEGPQADREIFNDLLNGDCQLRIDFKIVEEIEIEQD